MDFKEGTVEPGQKAISSVQDVTDNKDLQCTRRNINQGKADRLSVQACTMWWPRSPFNLTFSSGLFGQNDRDSFTRNRNRSVKAPNENSMLQETARNYMHSLILLSYYTQSSLSLKTNLSGVFRAFGFSGRKMSSSNSLPLISESQNMAFFKYFNSNLSTRLTTPKSRKSQHRICTG